jgi:hypothetical protein
MRRVDNLECNCPRLGVQGSSNEQVTVVCIRFSVDKIDSLAHRNDLLEMVSTFRNEESLFGSKRECVLIHQHIFIHEEKCQSFNISFLILISDSKHMVPSTQQTLIQTSFRGIQKVPTSHYYSIPNDLSLFPQITSYIFTRHENPF